MNELFLSAQKLKLQLENEINDLNYHKCYNIKYEESQNFQQDYKTLQEQLQYKQSQFNQSLQQLQQILYQIQSQLQNSIALPNQSVLERKCQNLESQIRELEHDFVRTHRIKIDHLNKEKDRYQLYGYANFQNNNSNNNNQDSNVSLLIKEQNLISEGQKEASEMLETGTNIMASFQRQGDLLKKSQRKVLTIANEIGLSNQLARMISSRAQRDNCVLATLAILLFLFMLFLYFIVKPFIGF